MSSFDSSAALRFDHLYCRSRLTLQTDESTDVKPAEKAMKPSPYAFNFSSSSTRWKLLVKNALLVKSFSHLTGDADSILNLNSLASCANVSLVETPINSTNAMTLKIIIGLTKRFRAKESMPSGKGRWMRRFMNEVF